MRRVGENNDKVLTTMPDKEEKTFQALFIRGTLYYDLWLLKDIPQM